MSVDPIIEKIKKLLRMKRGGTADEIAEALRLAQNLAEKHGIDLGSVDENDEGPKREQPLSHEDAMTASRLAKECIYAALICKHFFNVEPLTRRVGWRVRRITFIGTAWDIEIALYVYRFLVGHFRREWKAKRGRCRNRAAFISGMFDGLCYKLKERQPKEVNPLAVSKMDRRLVYLKEKFGEIKDVNYAIDHEAEAARHAGIQAGLNTEIRGGVKAGEENKTATLPAPANAQLLLG